MMQNIFSVLWALLVATAISACGGSSDSSGTSGNGGGTTATYTYPADGKTYPIGELDGKIWMLRNFDYVYRDGVESVDVSIPANPVFNRPAVPSIGRAYPHATAVSLAPAGWRLPSLDDWRSLHTRYGTALLKGGSSGFELDNSVTSCDIRGCVGGFGAHMASSSATTSVIIQNDGTLHDGNRHPDTLFLMVRYVRDR